MKRNDQSLRKAKITGWGICFYSVIKHFHLAELSLQKKKKTPQKQNQELQQGQGNEATKLLSESAQSYSDAAAAAIASALLHSVGLLQSGPPGVGVQQSMAHCDPFATYFAGKIFHIRSDAEFRVENGYAGVSNLSGFMGQFSDYAA